MKRLRYFDTLRLIAIFVVYVTHFIAYFHSAYFSYWKTPPTSYFLEGVTGKLGVALFGVILGYFAYMSKDTNATHYTVKRYGFFVVSGLVINSLYAIAAQVFPDRKAVTLMQVISNTFSLGDGIFATYWCIPVFFLASIISYLNGKANAPAFVIIIEIYILYKMNMVWLAVCLMGNLVARYSLNPHPDLFRFRLVRIALWVVLFFGIKRKESAETYMIDGVCCAIMIMIIMRGSIVQKVLNCRILSKIGEQNMAIYILHPLIYVILGKQMFKWLAFMPYKWAFLITLVTCFAAIVLASFPTMWLINTATKYISIGVKRVQASKLYGKLFSPEKKIVKEF